MKPEISNKKVTFYSTVLNEEENIRLLLDSVLSQTRKPNEIIIVDGGSKDRTIDIINEYKKKGADIKLISQPGVNVAQGRNLAIQNAKFNIIASTDAGCRVEKDWLEKLVEKFDDNTDIVTGGYLPEPKTVFEESVAEVMYPDFNKVPEDWPSQQSIAFRKSVWEIVHFPEYCYRSEDSWFNIECRKEKFKYVSANEAKVYWRPRKNLREVFVNTYNWTKSNIENNVKRRETISMSLYSVYGLLWRLACLIIVPLIFFPISILLCIFLFIVSIGIMLIYYPNERKWVKKYYKNIINYTNMIARVLAFSFIVIKKKRFR